MKEKDWRWAKRNDWEALIDIYLHNPLSLTQIYRLKIHLLSSFGADLISNWGILCKLWGVALKRHQVETMLS